MTRDLLAEARGHAEKCVGPCTRAASERLRLLAKTHEGLADENHRIGGRRVAIVGVEKSHLEPGEDAGRDEALAGDAEVLNLERTPPLWKPTFPDDLLLGAVRCR